jgi:radical SAM superfamily enzyme YgiQ (UPF0313 family)
MIDVLLVHPREQGGFFERMPPIGLAYIAASLEREDYATRILDLEIERAELEYFLHKWQPRVLGISGTTHTRFEAFDIATRAKQFNQDIITVYGGVHATFTPIDTLAHVGAIDFMIRGEGEYAMARLVKAIDRGSSINAIPGVVFRDHDDIIDNSPVVRINNLDALPRPAYHLLKMTEYEMPMEFTDRRSISLITSRGCTAKCNFCSASRMFTHHVTFHSASRIIGEIEHLFNTYHFNGIKFFDSTLTIERSHIVGLCDEIIGHGLIFPWECEIRVGTVDESLLALMRRAGCYYVNFGIESASQKVLNAIGKGFTVPQAVDLLKLCHDHGMKTKVFFSFGHIGETQADVETTFAFINEHASLMDVVASGAGVRIYPGTRLEQQARACGFLPEDFSWSHPYHDTRLKGIVQTPCVPVLLQPQMGVRELEDIAVRIYHRRFSGLKGIMRGLGKLTKKEKLKKLWGLVHSRIRRMCKPRVNNT